MYDTFVWGVAAKRLGDEISPPWHFGKSVPQNWPGLKLALAASMRPQFPNFFAPSPAICLNRLVELTLISILLIMAYPLLASFANLQLAADGDRRLLAPTDSLACHMKQWLLVKLRVLYQAPRARPRVPTPHDDDGEWRTRR